MKVIYSACLVILLVSFSGDQESIGFCYPKNKNACFTMATGKFRKFSKEWRGEDYYYLCENGEGDIICSVLFYKLNKDEQKLMVDSFDPKGESTSPAIPYIYFSQNSNLKKYERNEKSWGEVTDEFMFRQNDIEDFEGIKMKQKHMYAYCMFDKNLFVNIHLSKTSPTAEDSTAMRQILAGLKKKNK